MNVANKIAFFNNTAEKMVTIHNYGIRIWDVDYTCLLYTSDAADE